MYFIFHERDPYLFNYAYAGTVFLLMARSVVYAYLQALDIALMPLINILPS